MNWKHIDLSDNYYVKQKLHLELVLVYITLYIILNLTKVIV